MAELRIYDSQGRPIRGGAGESQQVKDFFFDGVRLAVDAGRTEMFCFFRAKDNETARSEQYYAKYSYRSRSEMNGLYQEVKRRIEGEYGMILDTENEDTRFFELLGSSESGRAPESSDLDDVRSLLSNFESARVGVGSYSEAYGLFSQLFSNDGVSKIAVSDNATGRSLSAYDLVIEKGDYFGLELLGDTEQKVESLRERRRSAFDSEYGTEDDNDPISGLVGAALFGGIGVALVLAAIYGSCLGLGMALPGVGSPPFVDSCGPSLGGVDADVAGNGSQEIRITGAINGLSETNETLTVTVVHENETVLHNSSKKRQLNSSGAFDFTVRPDGNVTSLAPGDYIATVEYGGTSKNASFTVEDGTDSAEATSGASENDTASSTAGNDTASSTAGNDTASSTAGNESDDTSSASESTAGGSIESVSAQETVDGQTDSFQLDGAVTGVTNRTVNMSIDFSAWDGTSLNSIESKDVTVASDGTFAFTVPFDPNGTDGPYEVTVRYNESTASDTFESGSATDPQLENVSFTYADGQQAKINFRGNTSGFDGRTDTSIDVRLENDTATVFQGTVPVTVDDDGTFQQIGLNVSENSLAPGTYTLVVTYDDGTPVEDTYDISSN
ncbi:hypothetical protein [Haloarcula onubensis]|uniref:Uncharacterized protein n=1 Tax=Haloarcula onubensis TaxID=2950539 RepID=A0ABU2FJN8_9EURY|nr:hypothetical protein [Halomicroarcula sp. S3CR25-11]MDS0280970.1 hypothetical protein [Halomicroarcula sp. S3CR25-11]